MKTLVFHRWASYQRAGGSQRAEEKGWNIIWYGHRHSMWGDESDSAEYREVTAAGIKFYDLKAGKFYATFSPPKTYPYPLWLSPGLFTFNFSQT